MEDLGVVAGATASTGEGVSSDGLVVAGSSDGGGPVHAFRWTSTGGMVSLGWLSQRMVSRAYGISGNGAVVVGSSVENDSDSHAVAWSGGGIQDLGVLPFGESSWAYAANSSGSVIVGAGLVPISPITTVRRAVRWHPLQSLGTFPGGLESEALDVSYDGAVIVGYSSVPGFVNRAFRWTSSGGMVSLGIEPATAYGVSGDGSIVVGAGAGGAMLWSKSLGMVDLNTYLPSLGINLEGWTLSVATAVSDDGRTIVGNGQHDNHTEAWVATLVARCAANCDGSTAPPVLNVDDFACFQARFVAGDARANCDGSTGTPALNVLDFVCFMQRFAAGCP